jgi:hypothetical protein
MDTAFRPPPVVAAAGGTTRGGYTLPASGISKPY